METGWMAKQLLDLQKAAFDHAYETMARLQQHGEHLTGTLCRQAAWLPADSHRMMEDWNAACEKGRLEWKSAMDDQFDRVRDIIGASATKPEK